MPDTPETTRGPYSFVIGDYLPGTKYVLRRQLGQGGMGAVYEVVKRPHIVGVAKVMLPQHAKHPEMVERFEREVSILAKLSHPNIVRVKDCETLTDGTPFYVMDKVEGTSLRGFLQDMPAPPPKMIYEIIKGILEGLYCIHEMGIVHRDIKPENVVLDAPQYGDPGVKLIDFGIADDATSVHVPGAVIGTPTYLAREQMLGEKATIQTDIYAAGVVLYEMIAQLRPFDYARGRGADAFREEILDLTKPAPPLRLYAPWVPESVEKVIMSALSKDPKKRPESAYTFLVDIYDFQFAKFASRVLTEVNTTEPEFTTAIESAARAADVRGESTARYDIAPPVEGSAPELAPEDVQRELEVQRPVRASHSTMSAPEALSVTRVPKNGTARLGAVDVLPSPARAEPSPSPSPSPAPTPQSLDVSGNAPVSNTVTPPIRRRAVPGYVAMLLSMTLSLGAVAAWRAYGRTSTHPSTAAVPVAPATALVDAPLALNASSVALPARALPPPPLVAVVPSASARVELPAAPSPSTVALVRAADTTAPKSALRTPSSTPTARPRAATPPPKASSEHEDSLEDLLAIPRTAHRPGSGL